MKIKDVITKTGLTDRAIRLYIEKDLIKPEYDENYNGRKSIVFSEKDVEQLENIALLRKADFSIPEIKALQEGGETAQVTIKEYVNRLNEKIQYSKEIIEKISTLVNEENITIEIICEKLSNNLENEKVPAEDMELTPKEQKEKTVFTVISAIGMVLSGVAVLLAFVFVALSALSLLVSLASGAGIIILIEEGLYENSIQELQEQMQCRLVLVLMLLLLHQI